MMFTNLCSIMRTQLKREDAVLVKVLNGKKYIYYYLDDTETLEQLTTCPQTTKACDYYFLKLSDLSEVQLSELIKSPDTLIDDNDDLNNIDNAISLNWQLSHFVGYNADAPVLFDPLPIDPVPIDPLPEHEEIDYAPIPDNLRFISKSKANILKHLLLTEDFIEIFLSERNRASYDSVKCLLRMQEHVLQLPDLLFIIEVYTFTLSLEECRYKTVLLNKLGGELGPYAKGITVLIVFGNSLITNGFSSQFLLDSIDLLIHCEILCEVLNLLIMSTDPKNLEELTKQRLKQVVTDPISIFNMTNTLSGITSATKIIKSGYSFFSDKVSELIYQKEAIEQKPDTPNPN